MKKYKVFILLTLCIIMMDSIFVLLTYKQTYSLVHQQEQRLARHYLNSFDIAYQATEQNMLQIAHVFANDPNIQIQFLKGKNAVESEGGGPGGEKADKARKQLYQMVSTNWNSFSDKFKARQLHFHLGPGSTSFLRVHKPQKFGDNMDNVRYTIVDTNKFKQQRTGFETGRVYSGIRGVVPVMAINELNQKEHVGAVESGTSFATVIENVTQKLNVNVAVLLHDSHLRKNVWPDFLEKILQTRFYNDGLVVEQTSSDEINELMALRSTEEYKKNDDIQFQTIYLNDKYYLFAEKKLRDYVGSGDNTEPDAGLIVVWEDITHLYDSARADIINNTFYALAAFLILECLIFHVITFVTKKLNLIIARQTSQIQCRNNVLEGITHQKPIESIFEEILTHIAKANDSFLYSLLLVNQEKRQVKSVVASRIPEAYSDAISIKAEREGRSNTIVNDDFFSNERVIVPDIQSTNLSSEFKQLAQSFGFTSYCIEPILNKNGESVAAIVVYSKRVSHQPSSIHLNMLHTAANLITLAMDRNKANEKMRLLSNIFEQSQEGINITDSNGVIVDVSPAFTQITGYSRDDVIGKKPSIMSSGRHGQEFFSDMWETIQNSGSWFGQVWNKKKDGSLYAEELSISTITDDDGNPLNYVGIFHDITQKKLIQDKLEKMAHFDNLTNLPNRTLMKDRLKQAMSRCLRLNTALAVCFIDLDNFKPINDTYGHEVGDKVLIEISQRINTVIREGDTLARHGGDEFILLLDNLAIEGNESEQLLKRILETIKTPFTHEEHSLMISASIGYTVYPKDNSELSILLKHADEAMYQVKMQGRSNFLRYKLKNK